MSTIITGGCGFIGLQLAATLFDEGHSVYLFDLHSKRVIRCLADSILGQYGFISM